MPLTSSSTIAEAKAAYLDNADYDTTASASKARDFVQACRFLLLMMPKRVKGGPNTEQEIDPAVVKAELDAALTWLAANGGTSESSTAGDGVILPQFHDFRG